MQLVFGTKPMDVSFGTVRVWRNDWGTTMGHKLKQHSTMFWVLLLDGGKNKYTYLSGVIVVLYC